MRTPRILAIALSASCLLLPLALADDQGPRALVVDSTGSVTTITNAKFLPEADMRDRYDQLVLISEAPIPVDEIAAVHVSPVSSEGARRRVHLLVQRRGKPAVSGLNYSNASVSGNALGISRTFGYGEVMEIIVLPAQCCPTCRRAFAADNGWLYCPYDGARLSELR